MTMTRGEYCVIRRGILDGPDFQQLPALARWALVALTINFGPAGVEVYYPAALLAVLSAQTGVATDDLATSLDTLEAHGWIGREQNVVVVVGHLEHAPHLSDADPKHRRGVQRHVAGLPHLAIVQHFIRRHPAWFPAGEAEPGGFAWALYPKPEPKRPDGNTPGKDPHSPTATPSPATPWVPASEADVADRLTSDAGRIALAAILHGTERKAAVVAELTAVLDGLRGPYTAEQIDQALSDYASNGMTAGKTWHAAHFRAYLRRVAMPAMPAMPAGNRAAAVEDGDAALLLNRIRKLSRKSETPGRGAVRYIPRDDVARLGEAVVVAYDAIGGADRVLAASGETWGFLLRDFTAALRAAQGGGTS